MRTTIRSILPIVLLTGTACADGGCDISCKIELALNGDGEAALKVAQESKATQTQQIVTEWYRIAAENGNASGQFEFGNRLVADSKSRYDCIRAVYWYQRAQQNGHPLAGASLQRVQAILARKKSPAELCTDR